MRKGLAHIPMAEGGGLIKLLLLCRDSLGMREIECEQGRQNRQAGSISEKIQVDMISSPTNDMGDQLGRRCLVRQWRQARKKQGERPEPMCSDYR